jgi:hypothetical protein
VTSPAVRRLANPAAPHRSDFPLHPFIKRGQFEVIEILGSSVLPKHANSMPESGRSVGRPPDLRTKEGRDPDPGGVAQGRTKGEMRPVGKWWQALRDAMWKSRFPEVASGGDATSGHCLRSLRDRDRRSWPGFPSRPLSFEDLPGSRDPLGHRSWSHIRLQLRKRWKPLQERWRDDELNSQQFRRDPIGIVFSSSAPLRLCGRKEGPSEVGRRGAGGEGQVRGWTDVGRGHRAEAQRRGGKAGKAVGEEGSLWLGRLGGVGGRNAFWVGGVCGDGFPG